jgi:hypothetical protein
MTAAELHHRSGNLVTRRAFVPMAHELIHYLSAGHVADANVAPGTPATLRTHLPVGTAVPESLDVLTPSGEVRSAAARPSPQGLLVHFAGTAQPGLYRVTVPGQAQDIPFAVSADPRETAGSPLTPADRRRIRRHVDIFHAHDTAAMLDAVRGEMPGREIWRTMLLCALLVLLTEVAVGHWVNIRRRTETAREVDFGGQHESAESIRARFVEGRATNGREERA